MFVLGIDPGLSRCGYGALEVTGGVTRAAAVGVIRTAPSAPLAERLAELQAELGALIAEIGPRSVAVERVFFGANARTAMSVAQAAGIAMAAAATAGCSVVEYTPNQVKEAVCGYGAAPKEQVEAMVRTLLAIDQPLRPVDAADAVALALCHLAHAPSDRLTEALS